jgi:hypothetical protein
MKKVAVLQSNYIPWKGYFDMIAAVDEFIVYDDVQFTKNDWRNRNKIKTSKGVEWISIPVGQNISRKIREVTCVNTIWQTKHWKTLSGNYARAPYFGEVAEFLKPLYMDEEYATLSQANRRFIEAICGYLGISTLISDSSQYEVMGRKTDSLIGICGESGASHYLSGPSAKNYLVEGLFEQAGIEVSWFSYDGYREYQQLWGDFEHQVSILDLLFNCGPESRNFMQCGKV